MRFALVNDVRCEASPGLIGYCPGCSQPVIAKCGTQKVWHWAHRGTRSCDPWWEPETPWHRAWKDQFPARWQEVIRHSEAGEKHIADVSTERGLVVEFQHSHLQMQERVCTRGLPWEHGLGRGRNAAKEGSSTVSPGTEALQSHGVEGPFHHAQPGGVLPGRMA